MVRHEIGRVIWSVINMGELSAEPALTGIACQQRAPELLNLEMNRRESNAAVR
jgi:hypothetical protein